MNASVSSPSQSYLFQPAFERLRNITDCKTDVELAEFFHVRQSSISDAKRRQAIPGDWLVALMREKWANPDWILTGQGPRFVRPADYPPNKVFIELYNLGSGPIGCFSTQYLLMELLCRAKASE